MLKKSRLGETMYVSQSFEVRNGEMATKHVFVGGQRIASVLSHFKVGSQGSVYGLPPGHGGTPPGQGGVAPGQTGSPSDGGWIPPGHRRTGGFSRSPNAPGATFYFHLDHLGSTSILTDSSGEIHEHLRYFPDGETWIQRGPRRPINAYHFSSKLTDPETGFSDFGARFYDPKTSLWLSVDPAFSDGVDGIIGRSMMLSPYAYAAQNPIGFVDPDGRDTCSFIYGIECPSLNDVAIAVGRSAINAWGDAKINAAYIRNNPGTAAVDALETVLISGVAIADFESFGGFRYLRENYGDAKAVSTSHSAYKNTTLLATAATTWSLLGTIHKMRTATTMLGPLTNSSGWSKLFSGNGNTAGPKPNNFEPVFAKARQRAKADPFCFSDCAGLARETSAQLRGSSLRQYTPKPGQGGMLQPKSSYPAAMQDIHVTVKTKEGWILDPAANRVFRSEQEFLKAVFKDPTAVISGTFW